MTRMLPLSLALFLLFAAAFRRHDLPMLPRHDGSSLTETEAQEIADAIHFNVLGKNKPAPTVEFVENMPGGGVAMYLGGNDNQIWIARRVVETLERHFGERAKSALAIIVGHEMHHAHEGQSNIHFGNIGKHRENYKAEWDADFYGLLYAHAAGYEGCLGLHDQLFEVLKIQDSPGHPSKIERQQINDQVKQAARQNVAQFEVANWLLLLGGTQNAEAALDLFSKVEKELASFRQVHFSKGLAQLSLGIAFANLNEIYPVEVQSAEFLNLQRNLSPEALDAKRAASYLEAARQSFDRAAKLGKGDFFEARLGVACAMVAQGLRHFPAAADWLASLEIEYANQPARLARIELVKAILQRKQFKNNDALLAIQVSGEYPKMAKLAALNLEPAAAHPCDHFNLPKMGISDSISANGFLTRIKNGEVTREGNPDSDIICYANGFYKYLFQEPKHGHFNLPAGVTETAADLNLGAGRWRLLRSCNPQKQEILVELDERGNLVRTVKVVRNFKS